MIYDQLMGVKDSSGYVQLFCKVCKAPAKDGRASTLVKVCSQCGVRLGEWVTETQQNCVSLRKRSSFNPRLRK
jgi:hypothetical protein